MQVTTHVARDEHRRAVGAACASLLAVEALGSVAMWGPIPLAWIWIGARLYDVTGSAAAGGGIALVGFVSTTILTMRALVRLDRAWVALRRRAGREQREGALTQIVVVSATLAIALFLLWYYVLERAYVIPFMPSR